MIGVANKVILFGWGTVSLEQRGLHKTTSSQVATKYLNMLKDWNKRYFNLVMSYGRMMMLLVGVI